MHKDMERISNFRKEFKESEILNFSDVLQVINETIFDGKATIGNTKDEEELDKEERQIAYRLSYGERKVISIISRHLNKTTGGLNDPTVLIFGGDELTVNSGYEIHINKLRSKTAAESEELRSNIVLTAIIKAISFSSPEKIEDK